MEADGEDPHVVNVMYPAGLEERYLRPAVRLEIGPLASWVPSSQREIRPYAAEVVRFKRRFYPCRWARYETAVAGNLRLLPRAEQVGALERDYRAMGVMIFGERVAFGEILRGLAEKEREVNGDSAGCERVGA